MPKKTYEGDARNIELLEKLLAVQLHAQGATREQIARAVGKGNDWVNALLKGLPKKADN